MTQPTFFEPPFRHTEAIQELREKFELLERNLTLRTEALARQVERHRHQDLERSISEHDHYGGE